MAEVRYIEGDAVKVVHGVIHHADRDFIYVGLDEGTRAISKRQLVAISKLKEYEERTLQEGSS